MDGGKMQKKAEELERQIAKLPIGYISKKKIHGKDRFSLSHYYGPIGWFLPVMTISYLLFSIFNLCMFPILFKMGYSKGKFWGMIVPSALFAVLYGAWVIVSSLLGNEYLLFNALEYASKNMFLVNGGIIAVATLILLCSFLLSKNLYSNREF